MGDPGLLQELPGIHARPTQYAGANPLDAGANQ